MLNVNSGHPQITIMDEIDWSLTTWEGSRREQYRRWAQLSLREIVQAQEEMQELAKRFGNQDIVKIED